MKLESVETPFHFFSRMSSGCAYFLTVRAVLGIRPKETLYFAIWEAEIVIKSIDQIQL